MLAYHLTSVRSSRGVVPSLVSWLDPPCTTRQKPFFPNCGQENSTHLFTCPSSKVKFEKHRAGSRALLLISDYPVCEIPAPRRKSNAVQSSPLRRALQVAAAEPVRERERGVKGLQRRNRLAVAHAQRAALLLEEQIAALCFGQ
jgi:hypothetical protein